MAGRINTHSKNNPPIEECVNYELLDKFLGREDPRQEDEQDIQTNRDYILTEIEVLDKLLGYDKFERPDIHIEPGSIVLIRGEPGAGKTTLGLQILSNNLAKDKSGCKYAYFSLEREPGKVLEDSKKHYGFFSSENIQSQDGRILKLGTEVMEYLIQWLYAKTCGTNPEDFISKFEEAVSTLNKWRWPAVGLAVSLVKNLVLRTSEEKLNDRIRQLAGSSSRYPIVFIDSLNVLVYLLQKNLREYLDKVRIPERLLLNAICTSIREVFCDSVVIFTGEYHYQDMSKQSAVSESFFCDIEVALFSEPVVVTSDYDSKFESPLGSNVLSLAGPDVKSIQTQSFCRVLKSRHTPNQSRRCVYDIVSNNGVEFYETYPGDGHLILFAENTQQWKIWNEFFDKDMPLLYPALRYDSFDKSSLPRRSAAQRRFRYVPPRIDMTLTSFDNHWINWYSELCFKSNIADTVQSELGLESFDENPKLLPILNDICFELSIGQTVNVFLNKIHPKIREFFNLIHDRIIEGSEDNDNSGGLRDHSKELFDTDTLNDYVSELFKVFVSIDPKKEGGAELLNINRPCLQCLWCRCLIRRLYEKLNSKQLKDIIINKCNSCLNKGKDESTESVETAYGKKLGGIIQDAMLCCHQYDTNKCVSRPPKSIKNETELMDFLTVPDKPCQWRKKIASHMWEFVLWRLLNITARISESKGEKSGLIASDDTPNEKILEQLQDLVSAVMPKTKSEQVNSEQDCISFREELSKKLGNEAADSFLECLLNDNAWQKLQAISDEIRDSVVEEGFLSDKTLNQYEKVLSSPALSTKEPHDHWLIILARLFYDVIQGPVHYRLITPIPGNKLRLFGERKSNIIHELEDHKLDSKRPIHRPERLFSLRDQNTYCSIPYDANISFLTFRRDNLIPFYTELKKNESKRQNYIKTIEQLILNQEKALKDTVDGYTNKYEDATGKIISELVANSLEGLCSPETWSPPKTWEEIIAYFILNQQYKGSENHFLIETRTQDSFLATMLEFVWSCGINLRITKNYAIEKPEDTLTGLMRAFYLMAIMFQNRIIPVNSTLDVQEFSRLYSRPKKEKPHSHKKRNDQQQADWTFARHWYSNLIEILSKPKETAKHSNERYSRFLWEHSKARLGIMPIPVSFSNYAKYRDKTWHVSCWGDWHLAIVSGSENIELGIDLINNLMSSDRICERASANAAIPTVEAFYEKYGDSQCFNLPERKDIELPNWTYNRLRQTFFKHAKSRSQVFDYHHCIREFHSVLEYVHYIGQSSREKGAKCSLDDGVSGELFKKIELTFDHIQEFRDKAFLLA